MFLILAGELLMAYVKYKKAKDEGLLPEEPQTFEPPVAYEPRPLSPDATRFERALHWLGIERTDEGSK